MERFLVGLFALAVGALYGFVARKGWQCGESLIGYLPTRRGYLPLRRDSNPILFRMEQWTDTAVAVVLVLGGLWAVLGSF